MDLREHPRFPLLRVCREHLNVYDVEPGLPGGEVQMCSGCPGAAGQQRWKWGDFNEWIHICKCCVIDVTKSGSRWSSFYCDECRERVVVRRGSDDPLTVPLGRHSLMNRIALPGARAFDQGAVEAFSDALAAMGGSIEALGQWRRSRLGLLLGGFDRDPLLAEVMAEGAKRWTKAEAFESLCAWWATQEPTP